MSCRVHTFPQISFWVPPKTFQKAPKVCVSGTISRTTAVFPSLNALALAFRAVKRRFVDFSVRASSGEGGGGWKARWSPPEMVGENVLRLIAGATASPIAQFVPAPTTFLHSLDPRVKLVWLLTLVVLPARSHVVMRVGMVVYLSLLSILTLPKQIWKVFQSASLCLATTMPEQLASALRWFMMPLECVGVPVSEMILTLLLSLRFINIVFDEVRNAALGIVARGINWKSLTFMETLDVFAMYIQRIFKNIFSHADQISQAMIVRGFRGNSRTHKLYCLSSSSFGLGDIVSAVCLLALVAAAILAEHFLV